MTYILVDVLSVLCMLALMAAAGTNRAWGIIALCFVPLLFLLFVLSMLIAHHTRGLAW